LFAGSQVLADCTEPVAGVTLSVELLVIRPLKTDTRQTWLH